MSEVRTAPLAVLVTGAPGTGKSTLARVLARRLGAALLDLDTATADLTAVIVGLLGTDDLDDPRLASATRAARYEAIVAVAEENLRVDQSVVLVAPFTWERREPAAWTVLAARLTAAGGSPTLVWLDLDAAAVEHRLRQRGAARDRPKLSAGPGPAGVDLEPPRVPFVRADATGSPDAIADAVLERLRPTIREGLGP